MSIKNEKSSLQEQADDLYQAAIEAGYSKKRSQKLALRKLELLEKYDIEVCESNAYIRRQIPKRYLKGFDELPLDKKDKVVHGMGIDAGRGWWEDICIFREKGQVVIEEIVVGSERTDKEWVTKEINGQRVASFDARVAHNNDPSLEKELRKLSGGRAYG